MPFGEEVIVNEEVAFVELRIAHLVVAERDVGDGEIERAFHQPRRLESLRANVCVRDKDGAQCSP